MQKGGHCSWLRKYSRAVRERSEGELTDISEGNRCDKKDEDVPEEVTVTRCS